MGMASIKRSPRSTLPMSDVFGPVRDVIEAHVCLNFRGNQGDGNCRIVQGLERAIASDMVRMLVRVHHKKRYAVTRISFEPAMDCVLQGGREVAIA